jgi:hypothetical protein
VFIVFVTHPSRVAEVVFEDCPDRFPERLVPTLEVTGTRTRAPVPDAEGPTAPAAIRDPGHRAEWGVKGFDDLQVIPLEAEEVLSVTVPPVPWDRGWAMDPKGGGTVTVNAQTGGL